MIIYKQHK